MTWKVISNMSATFVRVYQHCGPYSTLQRRFYKTGVAGISDSIYELEKVVDMRSDTVTKPDARMRQAMANADVGDDVYGEDPTVNELQRRAAHLFGMESALFVPSGTMGNLISVMVHCQGRGQEMILGSKCHIHLYQQGGIAQIAGVHHRTVENKSDGTFDLDEATEKIRQPPDDDHFPISRLISVENSHNSCGGQAMPMEFVRGVREIATTHGLALHTDGARIVNAAVALGLSVAETLKYSDSVCMCLSKGLGAPVGSLIGGSEEFITMAKRMRKALGGGMRQIGVLAAPSLLALENAEITAQQDHKHARLLAEGIARLASDVISVDLRTVQTNIVLIRLPTETMDAVQFSERLRQVTKGERQRLKNLITVLTLPTSDSTVRAVIHRNLTTEDIELTLQKVAVICEEASRRCAEQRL